MASAQKRLTSIPENSIFADYGLSVIDSTSDSEPEFEDRIASTARVCPLHPHAIQTIGFPCSECSEDYLSDFNYKLNNSLYKKTSHETSSHKTQSHKTQSHKTQTPPKK